MNDYPENTVAIATVRGVPNVLVLRRHLQGDLFDWAHSATLTRYSCSNDSDVVVVEVLDVAPLDPPVYGPGHAEEEDEVDPCCLLYREMYLSDHEYGCPTRVRAEGRTWTPPADA